MQAVLLETGMQSSAIAVTTRVTIADASSRGFAAWQSTFTRAAAAASGFVSMEIMPAFVDGAEWHFTQRFQTPDALASWQHSAVRAQLIAALDGMRDPGDAAPADEAAPDVHALACVTEVVTTVVEPGREEAFQAWAEQMQASQATFQGYRGTLVQAPVSAAVPYWTTLVRFATAAQLDAWLASADRAALLGEADPQVSRWQSQRMASPFAGWFPAAPNQAAPAAWKQTALVLLVLFPVVMLEIRFLSPLLAGLPLAVSTFIGNALSVSLVSWPLMMFAVWGLGWWLRPDPAHRARMEALGACTVAALYAAEMLFFTFLY